MYAQNLCPEVYEICQPFELSDIQMREIMGRLYKEIEMGLDRATKSRAVVKCFVTYVHDLPTGSENGKYLALDLGGANFRVILLKLNKGDTKIIVKSYILKQELKTGPGENLFNAIAENLSQFVKEQKLEDENLSLAISFSFPIKQLSLNNGILVSWSKGFNCAGVVGKDVCQFLQEAIDRRGDVKINIVAILSDSTGTLTSCAYKHQDCRIGLIIGTGCNAAYVERMSNTQPFELSPKQKPNVIINTEWGAFGDNGVLDFIRTKYDKVMDQYTLNKGRQTFEKCVAGMYLGELVRLIIVNLMDKKVIFAGQDSELIRTPWKFETRFIYEIESATIDSHKESELVMNRFGFRNSSQRDLNALRYICGMISRRSAMLVACGLACLIKKVDQSNITIGIDGNVYRYHPHYHKMLLDYLSKLVPPERKYQIVASEDGPGRGAALIAAVASGSTDPRESKY